MNFLFKGMDKRQKTVEVPIEWLARLKHIAFCENSYSRETLVAYLESFDLLVEGGLDQSVSREE